MLHKLKNIIQKFLLGLIKIYQNFISPLGRGVCRFQPTCSEYAYQAVEKFGPLKGLSLSSKRILKCHPLGESGYDPIPENNEKKWTN